MSRIPALLAITLSLAAPGVRVTPAVAFSETRTQLVPLQIPTAQPPLPPRVPKLRPQYCETHNCIVPPRPF